MSRKFAVLIDGGFVCKVLQKQFGRPLVQSDITAECSRIVTHPAIRDGSLLRYYYYDAPPIQKAVRNPIDGFCLDLGKSSVARASQSLHDSLELTENVAVRRGETVFHGWKLGAAATKDIQRNPRTPIAKDFVPDIKQKGVDLRIGLDIARLALRNIVETIVIVAGDSDLIPACKFARREGVLVYLDHLKQNVNRELQAHVDLVL